MSARALISLLALAGGLGCAAGLPEPTAAQVAAAASRGQTVSLEELRRGRSLYAERCSGCHALKHPTEHPPDVWPREVEEMREKQGVRLSAAEIGFIVSYLSSASALAMR